MLVASGLDDVDLVVGGEKMARLIPDLGIEDETDPEYLRQRCVGMPGPSFWAMPTRRRMEEHGTTEEDLADVAVKARQGRHAQRERALPARLFTREEVLKSALVSYPLRLYEICSGERRRRGGDPLLGRGGAPAHHDARLGGGERGGHRRFDDGLPRALATSSPPASPFTARPATLSAKPWRARAPSPGISRGGTAGQHRLLRAGLPEEWGLCQPGEAESLMRKGETLRDRQASINPSGGSSASRSDHGPGIFEVCEALRLAAAGPVGSRQVPTPGWPFPQSIGLGGNATAVVSSASAATARDREREERHPPKRSISTPSIKERSVANNGPKLSTGLPHLDTSCEA